MWLWSAKPTSAATCASDWPPRDRGLRQRQAAQRPVPVRARPERPAEVASDGEAVDARDLFEDRGRRLLARVSGEIVAHEPDCPEVDRGSAAAAAAAERQQAVGDRDGDLGAAELADWVIDVGK